MPHYSRRIPSKLFSSLSVVYERFLCMRQAKHEIELRKNNKPGGDIKYGFVDRLCTIGEIRLAAKIINYTSGAGARHQSIFLGACANGDIELATKHFDRFDLMRAYEVGLHGAVLMMHYDVMEFLLPNTIGLSHCMDASTSAQAIRFYIARYGKQMDHEDLLIEVTDRCYRIGYDSESLDLACEFYTAKKTRIIPLMDIMPGAGRATPAIAKTMRHVLAIHSREEWERHEEIVTSGFIEQLGRYGDEVRQVLREAGVPVEDRI